MKINEINTITYNGDLILKQKNINLLDNQYKIINGFFDCSNNKLTSLEGSPEKVNGSFNCSGNLLTSLEKSPEIIYGIFTCSNNKLISLKGNIKYITGNFHCTNNKKLKNVKQQIIKYQIKAENYYTDEGYFKFEEIKEEFEDYGFHLLKKEEIRKNKEHQQKHQEIKKNLTPLKNKDFGLSI